MFSIVTCNDNFLNQNMSDFIDLIVLLSLVTVLPVPIKFDYKSLVPLGSPKLRRCMYKTISYNMQ